MSGIKYSQFFVTFISIFAFFTLANSQSLRDLSTWQQNSSIKIKRNIPPGFGFGVLPSEQENIALKNSTAFGHFSIVEVITATNEFGQEIVNITLAGSFVENLIQKSMPEIATKILSIQKNQCLSPQRSGVETIDLDRYGFPESPAFQAAPYDVYVLEPQYRDPNAPLRSRDIIEPHVIVEKPDGKEFLGALCFN